MVEMNRCDWMGCGQIGLWDGVEPRLLNEEGKKKINPNGSRFLYLCPEHFQLAVGNLAQQITPKQTGKPKD